MTYMEEAGFTLVEVMVATLIAGIIFGVLAEGVILGFRNMSNTDQRVSGSNDTSLISNYFVPDMQSAESVVNSAAGGRFEAEAYCTGTQGSGSKWSGGKYVYPTSGATTTCTLPAPSAVIDTLRVAYGQKSTSYTGTLSVDGVNQTPACSVPAGSGVFVCSWAGAFAAAAHTLVIGNLANDGSSGVDYVEAATCGAAGPLLRLGWTDRATSVGNVVTYAFESVAGENRLVRRRCIGGSATPVEQQTVARGLAASPAAFAVCQPASCLPVPVIVTLELTEPVFRHEASAHTYRVSASTRTGS